MLRIVGNIAALIELAERTGSLTQLRERLDYLHQWGEEHDRRTNVDMSIGKVNMDREEADVGLSFYTGDGERGMYGPKPIPAMVGGLNLYQQSEDRWNWSVNT